jgi:hypothetical protein
MTRFSAYFGAPAVLVVRVVRASLAVVLAPLVACIPNPDISGLPPFDGGAEPDVVFTPTADATIDATLPPAEAGTTDTGVNVDSGPQVATVTGIVVDYTQGNGSGVVPGALVSISAPGTSAAMTATTDASGLFTIPGVPSRTTLEINVSKSPDFVNGIAYSTTSLVISIPDNQTVNVFPVLHEGCFQTFVLDPAAGVDAGNQPVTLQNATCLSPRTGAYAAMTFDQASFEDPITHFIWNANNGTIRVEMIPLAYPKNGTAPDLSWAAGLPGAVTPPGLLGAAEYRVYGVNPGQPDKLLGVHDSAVTIAVPIYAASSGTPQAFSYSSSNGAWTQEGAAAPSGAQDAGSQLQYVTVTVPPPIASGVRYISWWAATSGATATTCVTGTLLVKGSALANVLVRAGGVNYLGSSTALTNANGLFCLDGITATVGGNGGAIGVAAAAALSGSVVYAGSQTFSVTDLAAGSCAAAADASTSCTALEQPIDLTPTATCVSGTVPNASNEAGVVTTLNATLDFNATGQFLYAQPAGIRQTAYVGQVTLGDGGAFCALAPPGTNLELVDPASPACRTGSIAVLNGGAALACGAGGCEDAGVNEFGCPQP